MEGNRHTVIKIRKVQHFYCAFYNFNEPLVTLQSTLFFTCSITSLWTALLVFISTTTQTPMQKAGGEGVQDQVYFAVYLGLSMWFGLRNFGGNSWIHLITLRGTASTVAFRSW